jgi:hypothetical protein
LSMSATIVTNLKITFDNRAAARLTSTTLNMPPINATIRAYMASLGRKGGARRTPAQLEATRRAGLASAKARSSNSLSALCRRHGVSRSTVAMRLRAGMSLNEALTAPTKTQEEATA